MHAQTFNFAFKFHKNWENFRQEENFPTG